MVALTSTGSDKASFPPVKNAIGTLIRPRSYAGGDSLPYISRFRRFPKSYRLNSPVDAICDQCFRLNTLVP